MRSALPRIVAAAFSAGRWPARVEVTKLIGMTVRASGLQELVLRGVCVTDSEQPAARHLSLLTKVVIQDMQCSLQGECALGAWLAEMPALHVLQICVIVAGHKGLSHTHTGRTLEKLNRLTSLREVRVASNTGNCYTAERVSAEYMLPVAGMLREVTGLTCLDIHAFRDRGVEHGLTEFLDALPALVNMEELGLHRLPVVLVEKAEGVRDEVAGMLGTAL